MSTHEELIEQGLTEVFAGYPKVRRNQATEKHIQEVISQFTGRPVGEVIPTLELFKVARYEWELNQGVAPVDTIPVAPTFVNAEMVEAEAASKVTQAQLREGIDSIYAKFPLLVPCEANDGLIVELCRRYSGDYHTVPTVAVYNDAVKYNPAAVKLIKTSRKKLIADIIELLATVPHSDAFILRKEKNKLESTYSDKQLRDRLEEIRRGQALSALSSYELRETVVAPFRKEEAVAAGKQHRFAPYSVLPKTIVPAGQQTAVPFDQKYYTSLSKYERDKINQRYSTAQINARFRGEV